MQGNFANCQVNAGDRLLLKHYNFGETLRQDGIAFDLYSNVIFGRYSIRVCIQYQSEKPANVNFITDNYQNKYRYHWNVDPTRRNSNIGYIGM